ALLDVIAALARSDWPALTTGATQLLDGAARAWSPATRDWLLRAAMLGALAQGDDDAVRHLDDGPGRSIPGNTRTLAYRAWMLALAAARATP
ncbi:MAG: hypothetical protein KIS89_11365, partial [Dokdonella sp.]|nr:hypothetical protein [Dokdonella sp.]